MERCERKKKKGRQEKFIFFPQRKIKTHSMEFFSARSIGIVVPRATRRADRSHDDQKIPMISCEPGLRKLFQSEGEKYPAKMSKYAIQHQHRGN